jgi:hypothetical protein
MKNTWTKVKLPRKPEEYEAAAKQVGNQWLRQALLTLAQRAREGDLDEPATPESPAAGRAISPVRHRGKGTSMV